MTLLVLIAFYGRFDHTLVEENTVNTQKDRGQMTPVTN